MTVGVVIMIIVFAVAIGVPVVWSIVGAIRGIPGASFGIAGTVWALALLMVTFVNMGRDWGKDGTDDKGDDSGSLVCRTGNTKDDKRDCVPLVWGPEDGKFAC